MKFFESKIPALTHALQMGVELESELHLLHQLNSQALQWRKNQFLAEALGVKETRISHRDFTAWSGILKTFAIDSNGQRSGTLAKFFRPGQWLAAPLKLVWKIWKLTKDQYRRAIARFVKKGLIIRDTKRLKYASGKSYSVTSLRLNVDGVMAVLARLGKKGLELPKEVSTVCGSSAASIVSTEQPSAPMPASPTLPASEPTLIRPKPEASVKESQKENVKTVFLEKNEQELVVLLKQSNQFPAEDWEYGTYLKLKQLARRRNGPGGMTVDRLKTYLLRREHDAVPGHSLAYLLQYWPSIWKTTARQCADPGASNAAFYLAGTTPQALQTEAERCLEYLSSQYLINVKTWNHTLIDFRNAMTGPWHSSLESGAAFWFCVWVCQQGCDMPGLLTPLKKDAVQFMRDYPQFFHWASEAGFPVREWSLTEEPHPTFMARLVANVKEAFRLKFVAKLHNAWEESAQDAGLAMT